MKTIADQAQRQQALEAKQSFIVQAPAGSGKTELLTQRFLKLLTTVDKNPEEVLAITFTRKAANEMRQRIFTALQSATTEKPTLAYKAHTWDLATQVLLRDQQEDWQLLNNPNRLRIQTIDSLSTYLGKQLPITSGLGSAVNIVEDAQVDYHKAADDILANLEDDVPWAEPIAILLLHLDNNLTLVKNLLVNMLSHRDQWLPHVINARNNDTLREHLEASLATLTLDTLVQLTNAFPSAQQTELLELLTHANTMLQTEVKSPFSDYEITEEFPQSNIEDLQHWRALATLLLTQKHEWRKSFDKRIGFPITADTKAEKIRLRAFKDRITTLTAELSDNTYLQQLLKESLLLPPVTYSETQWKILTALLKLLPILVAQLNINFQSTGHIDFIELSQRALQALEHEEAPTDLALALDYRIKHILIDEFQDTSVTQFRLLQLLTRGWQNDDGRTLFLVGDPMQSIYRFRAAEVGLFLQAKQYGVGDITLIPLTLTTNFRSSMPIVNWFNTIFSHTFPKKDDIAFGAISYVAAAANEKKEQSQPISLHQCDPEDPQHEAMTIVNIIKHSQQQDPQQSIAILVKTRRQLINILPMLKKANIAFNAVDIENLNHLPMIQDLTALTLALQHFGDRLAWLAILRAPWCGLTLHDLHCLANEGIDSTIWQRMTNNSVTQNLTIDGQKRLQQFVIVMESVLHQRGRFTLNQWVYNAWLSLRGPTTLNKENELHESQIFFTLLKKLESDGSIEKVGYLEAALKQLYAKPKKTNSLQIMTIHKAKGLEFGTVIMPSLETSSAHNRSRLLLWQERPTITKQIDLLLAPIKARKDDVDPIYDYIRNFEQRKNAYENMRLFYVAITRSKKHLHLLANFYDKESKPRSNSFLNAIWEHHRNDFKQYYEYNLESKYDDRGNLRRLALNTQLQQPANINDILPLKNNTITNIPGWHDTSQRGIGIIIHFILQQLNTIPIATWPKLLKNVNIYEILLRQQSIAADKIEFATQTIVKALRNMLASDRVQWLFDLQHDDIQVEYSLSYKSEGEIKQLIIDRTFIDKDIRWIIDYKTAQPEKKQTVAQFLQCEKARYQQQLDTYATAFSHIEHKPIKLGLYFPLIDAWIEWGYTITNKMTSDAKL